MLLTELIRQLSQVAGEMGSHANIDDALVISCGDEEFEIELVEPLYVPGCGCWHGAAIELRRVEST